MAQYLFVWGDAMNARIGIAILVALLIILFASG
jgi:hypothetical protein